MKKRSAAPCSSSSASSSSSSSSSCSLYSSTQPNHKANKPKRVRAEKVTLADDSTAAASIKSCRSSIYRGVSRHRWTGRFEAHLWDKNSWNNAANKRSGRQVYLGAYDTEEDAGRAYDLAALKYWGPGPHTTLNFPLETYSQELDDMQNLSKEEYIASLRRRSSGFSRGVSKYRGVARHHHNGRWEARIGRVQGRKYLYLGTFGTEEEAAAAYDRAAIELRGPNAITNLDISNYVDKLNTVLPEVQVTHECDAQMNPEINLQPLNLQQDANGKHVELMNIPKIESIDSIIVTETTEEHGHPWDISMDIGIHALLVPHIPLEKGEKASEVFDYDGFEDDIECIFEGESGADECLRMQCKAYITDEE